jgi:hypothetical protein
MNLNGSIKRYQDTLIQLYLYFRQNFGENQLVRGLWNAMANDISQQKDSLNTLPRSFWNQLKEVESELQEVIGSHSKTQIHDNKEDISLKYCFEQALRMEEPTILKIYAPIIRRLREGYTDQALDFYIIVKAHLTRIARMVEAFSGDPLAVQQSNLLLQSFEKEIQESQAKDVAPAKKPSGTRSVRTGKAAVKTPTRIRKVSPVKTKRAKKPISKRMVAHGKETRVGKAARPQRTKMKRALSKKSKRTRPLAKHHKIRPGRSKPLVEKVGIHRRRARR